MSCPDSSLGLDSGRIYQSEEVRPHSDAGSSLHRRVVSDGPSSDLPFCRAGAYKPAHQFHRFLRLMAVTVLVVRYAHLHMQPIQWYLKDQWMSQRGLRHPAFINSELVQALQLWKVETNLSVCRPFASLLHIITVTMDTSMEGWGGHA